MQLEIGDLGLGSGPRGLSFLLCALFEGGEFAVALGCGAQVGLVGRHVACPSLQRPGSKDVAGVPPLRVLAPGGDEDRGALCELDQVLDRDAVLE